MLTGLFTIVQPPQQPMERPDGEPDFDAWSQAGVQVLILGSFQVRGEELILEARLFDVALKKMELGKRYKAGAKDHRQVIHKFGDRVMETPHRCSRMLLHSDSFCGRRSAQRDLCHGL